MIGNRQEARGNKKAKIILRWIKFIILIYILTGIALYYFQEKFLLHPEPLTADHIYHFNVPFNEINIPINKNENFNIIQFLPKDAVRKGVVLYFHGNKKNITHYAKFADNFTKFGYEVWMPDYPGFGKTTGILTEKKLYGEALLVYKLAATKFSADSIIIYGRSFGTGIASQLASTVPCRQLILETPYYSVPALFSYYAPVYPTSFMSKFKLPVNEYLKNVTVPVTIFHGADDEIIPYAVTKKLKAGLKLTDEFITIENGKHNNLNQFKLFQQKLDSLLR
jgi:alpha-beta hydrolase superfamily lysophospholipase